MYEVDKDLSRELNVAKLAALKAGEKLKEYFYSSSLHVERKSQDYVDFVSEADLAAERIIIENILNIFPKDKILSEEEGTWENDPKTSSNRRWVIDPLDGTHNFVHRIPHFSVSIALEDVNTKEALLGVVYDPIVDELFASIAKSSTLFNKEGKWWKVQKERPLEEGVFEYHVGRDQAGSDFSRKARVAQKLQYYGHRSMGSMALSLAYTAVGRLDATYYECPFQPWDYKAGFALCESAGVKREILDPLFPGGNYICLAAKDKFYNEIQEKIKM